MKQQKADTFQMTPEIMDQIHRGGQEILDVFVQICEENNLRYYLIAGTLLGAVRHKGPIPWDEDVDVCMPRADLDAFKKIMLEKSEDELYHIHYYETDSNYSLFILRLLKKGTVYNTQYLIDKDARFRELWLDIFPLDNAPENSGLEYRFLGVHIALMKRLIANRSLKSTANKRLRGKIIHFFLMPFSMECMRTHTERLMCKWNEKECSYYVSWASHYHFLKQTMPKEWYEPTTQVFYNGKYYRAPHEWNKVLTQLYGDYMVPPPESERTGHGATEIKL